MVRFDLTHDELAYFQGQRCYDAIVEKYLPGIASTAWRAQAEELLKLRQPVSPYAYSLLAEWHFGTSPGSGAHHTHFGGLALHTLQNLEYADAWAGIYKKRGIAVNIDLLYAIIIMHDCMKKFIYKFDDDYNLIKAEDPFIAQKEDHHSWVLREMTARGFDKTLVLGVAAMHGIDDVALRSGVDGVGVVNHYLAISNSGLTYTPDDVRPEHVIAFLSDSDWHWSGQAQRKAGLLAGQMAERLRLNKNFLKVYLGSRFTFEKVGHMIERHGYERAAALLEAEIKKEE